MNCTAGPKCVVPLARQKKLYARLSEMSRLIFDETVPVGRNGHQFLSRPLEMSRTLSHWPVIPNEFLKHTRHTSIIPIEPLVKPKEMLSELHEKVKISPGGTEESHAEHKELESIDKDLSLSEQLTRAMNLLPAELDRTWRGYIRERKRAKNKLPPTRQLGGAKGKKRK